MISSANVGYWFSNTFAIFVLLYARPILELLLMSTSAILVEMFAMISVAVCRKQNPVQNIYSAKSTSP